MEQQSAPAKYLGTVKVSRGMVKGHTYPALRLPGVLGDIIGKRVGVYAIRIFS
ncbi:MAG: hypothetical protein ACXV7G_14110 [Halobacteriota archaeon]